MPFTRKQLSARITLAFFGFLCASVLGFIFLGSRLFAYDMVRRLRNEHPELAIIPQPLQDSTANTTEGISLARFGYTFDVPWNDLDTTRDAESVTLISFRSGRNVMFMDPRKRVDLVKGLLQSTAGSGKDPRNVLGFKTLASNYEFVKATLSIDPTRVSLLTPTREIIRTSILLLLKNSSTNIQSGVYSVEFNGFRGFQKGSPASAKGRTELQLFDNEDHEISIFISTKDHATAPITQADVNRILQTLRRADGAPDHGTDSPEKAATYQASTGRS